MDKLRQTKIETLATSDKRQQTGGKMLQDARVHPGHLVHNFFISSLVKIRKIRVF